MRAWASEHLADRPVLVADTLLDGLEIASKLAGLPLAAGKALRDASARVGLDLALTAPAQNRVTIRVKGERAADDGPHALVSGHADAHGFAWASAAGHRDLLAWIDSTSARHVYVTGACADAIVAAIGPRATVLGPARADGAGARLTWDGRYSSGNRRDGGWWWRLPLLAILWLAIALPIIAALVVAITLRRWAKDLPEVPDLAAWRAQAPQTSLVLAADGSHLAELPFQDGKVFGHRTLVPLDRVPKVLVDAVLAAEDVRFYEHHGVDYQAIARAAYINYSAGRVVEGASTITQQVARNLLPIDIGSARSAKRKVREALLARDIEKRWSKRDVLETTTCRSSNARRGRLRHGRRCARVLRSRRHRGRSPRGRAARRPHPGARPPRPVSPPRRRARPPRRDPRTHGPRRPDRRRDPHEGDRHADRAAPPASNVRHARALVHRAGARAGVVGAAGRGRARRADDRHRRAAGARGGRPGPGRRPRTEVGAGHRHARDRRDRVGPPHRVCRGDRRRARVGHEGSLRSLHAELPATGLGVEADGVYGSALAAGAITPGHPTPPRQPSISEYDEVTNTHWKPKSGTKFRGVVLAEDAFASSLNAPAIDVFDRVGPAPVIAFARRLGITTPISELRPMALGASCVKPIELARAYAVIARRGWAIAPRFVVRVRRGDDTLFDAAVPEDPWLDPARRFDRIADTAGADPDQRVGASGGQLVDDPIAFQLQDMMSAVVVRGTAAAAGASLGRPAAGKTGTTNDNTDAWFVGFTGRVLAATWIGFDDPTHKLGTEADGAHAALPLWMRAVRAAEGERPRVAVPGDPPAGMVHETIDRESGLLAAPHTGGVELWFRKGTAPTEVSGQPGTSPADFGRTAREF